MTTRLPSIHPDLMLFGQQRFSSRSHNLYSFVSYDSLLVWFSVEQRRLITYQIHYLPPRKGKMFVFGTAYLMMLPTPDLFWGVPAADFCLDRDSSGTLHSLDMIRKSSWLSFTEFINNSVSVPWSMNCLRKLSRIREIPNSEGILCSRTICGRSLTWKIRIWYD